MTEEKKNQLSELNSKKITKEQIIQIVQELAQHQVQLSERLKALEDTLQSLAQAMQNPPQINPIWGQILARLLEPEQPNPLTKLAMEHLILSLKAFQKVVFKIFEKAVLKGKIEKLFGEEEEK